LDDDDGTEFIKLLDFGIAQVTAPHQKSKGSEAVFGSPPYLAPEQALLRPTDNRTDIYSTGAMMYHLLTGSTPFSTSGSIDDVLKRIISENPIPLTQINPNIPAEVNRIVLKCMEKNPKHRYQSAEELRADIEQCHGKINESSAITPLDPLEPAPQATQIAQKPKRLRRLLYGAIATLAIGALSTGYILLGKNETRKPAVVQPIASNASRVAANPDQEPGPSIKYYSITLRLNTGGVKATSEGEMLCVSSADGLCSFALQEGSKAVKITLSKKGYRSKTISIRPDTNKEIHEQLEKERKKTRRNRTKSKKNQFLFE
jgi:serine/threonine protein kinase